MVQGRHTPTDLFLPFLTPQGKHAKCKQYVGHSAHVTNVRFSHDDRKLISLGGGDTSVMVWAHNAGSRDPATETGQSADPVIPTGMSSEDSDTDSEEEGNVVVACHMHVHVHVHGCRYTHMLRYMYVLH